ncbi:branched-chain amino acid ABC transporter permease/ATP-binding protein [Nocardioides sp. W7]|uniref:branched-chain amino acid ABC transporter permease/ATP-binding protein n=1 Tax=Nocardioides sp. W7 TaxID=2931390 RepID=UPI001FD31EA5|nr:branched-chain amino acid ABC transporter permease/ATP-binding protein [Nocardioides sp. W7]
MSGFDFGVDRLVIGLFTGLTYGLLAVGLVLVYRSSRFVNFAHGSIGAFGASVLALMVTDWGLPYWASFVVAIVVGGLLSGFVEILVVRRLEGRPALVGMIATLGLSQLIVVMSLIINSDGVSGFTYPKPTMLPTFEIQSLPIGTPYVAMLVLAPVLLAGLAWFLRYHRMGIGIRAAADDPDTARLEGIPARWMATLAWTIAGGIACFSAILVTPTTAGSGLEGIGPDLLLKGLAGAVIARMSSIPIAIAASLGIGVIEQVLLSNPDTRGLVTVVIALIIVVALLRQPQLGRAGQDKGRWRRVVLPPLPPAYRSVPSIRWIPRVSVVVGIAASVGVAYLVSNDTASVLSLVAGFTLVGLSVGLLTGVSGQLSLGQFAYAGIAAAASVHVAESTGNFLFGLLCGVLSAAAASALVGIPAMKLKGLALAVSTLAFALATSTWLLRQDLFLGDGIAPAKPTWWDYPLEYAVDYYLFALLMLCVGLWVTNNLRHGGFGRMIQALRDNEHAARAFTVPNRMRMIQLYAVSGALAGLGGIVVGHGQSQLTVNSFPADASIDVVALTVVGGLTVSLGPLVGALLIVGLPALVGMGMAGQAALAIGWLLVVIFLPDGLGGVMVRMRDSLYDGLARRHGLDPLRERHGVVDLDAEGHVSSPLHERPRLEGLAPRVAPGARTTGPILTVDGISRRFGGVVAVDHVSFQVEQGEILGVIGPNGAGKTTCFEIVAGFTATDRGRVVFDGIDVTGATPEERAQEGLVRSFQDAALFPTLTVHETLMVAQERIEPTRLWTSALGVRSAEIDKAAAADEVLERMHLTRYARRPVGDLSTGTRRVVELACLLTLQPRVLLLDEPSAGIAQSESEALGDLLLAIRAELGTTMVVIEHDLPLLSRLSDRMLAMNLGRVIATGTPDEVRNDPAVVTSYLGADQAAIHRSGLHLAAGPDSSTPDPLSTRIQPVPSR